MTTSPERRNHEIGAFFAANATRLHNIVRAKAQASEQVIEDACQTAWTTLLRRPDVTLDRHGLNWLATVAIHHAWRTAAFPDEIPTGSFQGAGHDGELGEPAHPDTPSAEDRAIARIEHRERLALVATLKPREREALYLKGLGYSYPEIARLTNSTYTAVNRRITEGRRALRNGGRTPRDREPRHQTRTEEPAPGRDRDNAAEV